MELNRSSAPADPGRYRPIGSAIPLRRRTGLEVFPSAIRASAVESASNAQAPTNLLSPSEFDRNRPPPASPLAALLGFGPFQRLQPWKPGYLGFAFTRHLPTSGFCTLLPVYVFRGLPALFHAGNALRVFLQGFFPSQSLRPLSESVTFVVLVPQPFAPELRRERRTKEPHLQGRAPCEDSSPSAVGLATNRRPLPSWFSDL